MKPKKNFTMSWSAEVEMPKETQDKLRELADAYDKELKRLEGMLDETVEDYIKDNNEAFNNENYPKEFSEWITDVVRKSTSWAIRKGWNMCYKEYEDKIMKA